MNTWDEDVRECPACYGTNFQTEEDGSMVCSDCGVQVEGAREEDAEENTFVGTETTTLRRQSQASQAERRRASILQREQEEKERQLRAEKVVDPELQFCEAVTLVTTELGRCMVEATLLPVEIYTSLEQVLTHWVLQRHAEVVKQRYHRSHVLSFIALAALHVRSSLLPRDLVVLCINGTIPYFRAAYFLPPALQNLAVKKAVVPRVPPRAHDIIKGMVLYGNNEQSWPALESFFMSGTRWIHVAAPLGNPGDTLRRVTAYLGLPDKFIARVERFQRLKRKAKLALDACGAPKPPLNWREMAPSRKSGAFSWHVPDSYACCGWPTNHTLLIDVINTIRLCYGWYHGVLPQTTFKSDEHRRKSNEADVELRAEWDHACKHMREWVMTGGGADATLSTWRTLSNEAILSVQGEALEEFCGFTEMTEDDTVMPSFALREFINGFKDLAFELETQPRDAHPTKQVSRETSSALGVARPFGARRTFGGLGDDKALQIGMQVQTVDEKLGRERKRLHPPVYKGHVGDRRGITMVWEEGAEIGLAWTMLHDFFMASPMSVGPCARKDENKFVEEHLVECIDRTMAMVLDYVNIEKKQSSFRLDVVPTKGGRKRRKVR